MKIYYAHPMTTYGSLRESRDIQIIQAHFQGSEVLNPNHPDHQAGCKYIRMAYFTELVKICDAIVGVPFPDGEWGSGVYAEMEQMGRLKRPTYTLEPIQLTVVEIDYKTIRPLSIRETSERVHGKKV